MKKHIILSIMVFVFFGSALNGQILLNGPANATILNENAFLDAAYTFNMEQNKGKGLIFPTVDLINFEFILDGYVTDDFQFEHYFNGMIVYNTATGTTKTNGNRSSTATAVTPGFYYFYNPNGASNYSITGGIWKPLGGANITEIMEQILQETNITNIGDTLAHYFSQTNLKDTVINLVKENSAKVKTLEISLNELLEIQSKTFYGTTSTASSAITIVSIEPQLTGDPVMLGAFLKVNALANLNSSATAINWVVAIENDNIDSARNCTFKKVIISYICNEDLTGTLSGIYNIAGR